MVYAYSLEMMTSLLFWTMLILLSVVESVASTTSRGYFVLGEESITNSDALSRCKDLGYDGLALIDSPSALSEVLNDINAGQDEYWIGMHYSELVNAHFWDSGFAVQWVEWTQGEPDNIPRDKCVRIRKSQKFGTYGCEKKVFAICGNHGSRSLTVEFQWQDMTTQDSSNTIWSGRTRSAAECVSVCSENKSCQYVAYDYSKLHCTTLSSGFDAVKDTKASQGSVIGVKTIPF